MSLPSINSHKKFSRVGEVMQISQPPKQTFHSEFGDRLWLKNHGKQNFISFSDHALKQLRKYFDSLDEKGTGSIGVQQLEDPFIAFGLSQSREQVQRLIDSVDLDGSGTIEFNEFLAIMLKIKGGKSSEQKNSAIFDFFQKLSKGNLGEEYDKSMSFKLNVSQFRRKKLLQAMMSANKDQREKGTKILQSFKKQVVNSQQLRDVLNESKKSSIFMYGFQTQNGRKKK